MSVRSSRASDLLEIGKPQKLLIHWKQRWTRVTTGANLRSKGQRSRSLGTKCKYRLRAHFRQKWIDLHRTKTKMICSSFYVYRLIHFATGNTSFLWYLFLNIRKGRMSQRPPGRAYTCLYSV